MRVSVDEDLCIGSGQCELFAPDVFEVKAVSTVKLPDLPERLYSAVRDAADACPVRAISMSGRG